MAPWAADALLILLRWLHVLAAVVLLGWAATLVLGPVHSPPGSSFARRFKEETGTTPYSWILGERVRAAEELLEQTDHSIDWIAGEVGFCNAATLRHHFGRSRGVSPQEYRRTFRMSA